MTAARIRIIRHEAVPKTGSFEVRFADGRASCRREAAFFLKTVSGATSACPISLLHGPIHTTAAGVSKNL